MDLLSKQLVELGISLNHAEIIAKQIYSFLQKFSPPACWQKVVKENFFSSLPFAAQQLLYKKIYSDWDKIPAPAWFPEQDMLINSHISLLMKRKGFNDYHSFHHWSVENYAEFWQLMSEELQIQFDKNEERVVDLTQGIESPIWFKDAKLNITNSCFLANENDIAIITQAEQGVINKISYGELNQLSQLIAANILSYCHQGDSIAIVMPMNYFAIAIYLAIIKSACVVVAIPDSFSADEIAIRLRIANAKMIFCQDHIFRDGKLLPLYEKIIHANAAFAIVLPAQKKLSPIKRDHDLHWHDFLAHHSVPLQTAISCTPQDHITILFSSGTTGEPKAIPWSHITPIKCASDAYLHHDIHPGDIFCWPTNLGWMMGPWLIFACLLNKATIALYEGTPNNNHFGKFIQDAKVSILGVVPTMVKTWRNSACMEGLDWRVIKLFTSTGERSSIDDMLYLMSLANYRPIIEYCGGTEIAGAYITGTVIQAAAPAAFTTPALGLDLIILDDQGQVANQGEVALLGPSIGLSTELLNKNHHQVYYADMPLLNGKPLRRHGDQIELYANGFYRLQGRVDDTMKLGGIKISSAEIEAILNTLPMVYETAAIAVNPPDGGPSQLVIYVITKPEIAIDFVQMKTMMQESIKTHLNPLFKIYDVCIIDALPRTASNKIMRRILRNQYQHK